MSDKKIIQEKLHNEQKFKWKTIKIFNSYKEALEHKTELLKKSENIKIKRSGPDGIKFSVKIGNKIKKEKKKDSE